MARNPTQGIRDSDSMWRFWEEFSAYEPQAKLGGIYANKTGYHNYRDNLDSDDYSVGEVFNDRLGPSKYASAIDITLNDSDMVLYSKRLDEAMRRRDPRLFIDGQPVLREFIGTLNNKTVYCYMLTGGRAQGVNGDSGVDWGRDKSHLWHIHISFIRKFCNTWRAMSGVLSIMKNENLRDWEFGPMATQFNTDDRAVLQTEATEGSLGYAGGGLPSWPGQPANRSFLHSFTKMFNMVVELKAAVDELSTAVDTLSLDNQVLKSQLDELVVDPADNPDSVIIEQVRYAIANP